MFNVKYASYYFMNYYELTFFSAYLSLFTGQTGSTVPSEFDCERYSQSAARNVPHQSLHTSRDVRAPRRLQRRQKHLDETRSADSEQVRVNSQFFAPTSQCTAKKTPHKQHQTLHLCISLMQLSIKSGFPSDWNGGQSFATTTQRFVSKTCCQNTVALLSFVFSFSFLFHFFLSLADIQQKDREVLELLQERVTLFSDLAEATGGQNVNVPSNSRNIFRADTPYAPQAEKLLNDTIVEGRQRSVQHYREYLVMKDINTAFLFISKFSGQTEWSAVGFLHWAFTVLHTEWWIDRGTIHL